MQGKTLYLGIVGVLLASTALWAQGQAPREKQGAKSAQTRTKRAPARKKLSKAERAAKRAARKELSDIAKSARVPKGVDAVEAARRLDAAIGRYREFCKRHASFGELCADAEFRAARLLAKRGADDKALAAFERSARLAATRFGARATTEAGHLLRRRRRFADALARYRSAQRMGGRYAVQASFWGAKVLAKLGRAGDARELWLSVARDAEASSSTRLRSFDEAALSALAERGVSAARRLIEEAEASFGAEIAAGGKKGRALAKRLERLRVRKAIAKAKTAGKPPTKRSKRTRRAKR